MEPMWWFLQNPKVGGIYNLGTGKARSWLDLANAAFTALNIKPNVNFIDMPAPLKEQYQYFTQAEMDKLQAIGCPLTFRSLEEAVADYLVQYLEAEDRYL